VPNATETNLYLNGNAGTAVPGAAVGWIDDSQLLVDNYTVVDGFPAYRSSTIYSSTGTVISSPPLPAITNFESLSCGGKRCGVPFRSARGGGKPESRCK
jgi:hypothetical protein